MTMTYIFGIAMLTVGAVSLMFNEFIVQLRREFWSWRRDDQDPQRDRWLNEYYRL